MTQHISLNHGDIAHEGFFDPIQEMLGAAAPNFRIEVQNSTTLRVVAGTENLQQSIAIQGRYRFRTTNTTAALPGGLPDGEHPVFVTASDNDFEGPIEDPDKDTDYTFGLEIKESGHTPSTALYRQVGVVKVASGAITGLEQTVSSVTGSQIEKSAFSSSGDIEWTRSGAAWIASYKNESVGTTDLVNLAVTTAKIAVGAIIAEKLGSEAVETAKIKALAVTAAKLAAESVTNTKIGEEAVTAAKIQALAITAAKLAAEAVETGKIANLAVTAAKLAASAVEESKIKDGAVTSRKAKLTCGDVRATSGLTLTESPQDVPGTSKSITPAVASILLVTAIFDFNYVSACQTFGWLNVDGVDQANFAGGFQPSTTAETCPQVWAVSLTAAAHTIKLRAQREKGSALVESGVTGWSYLLVAS